VDRALSRWASAGPDLEVVEIGLPGWEAATEAVGLILVAEAWTVHAELWRGHAAELSPDVAQRLEMGSLVEPSEVAAAWEEARRWTGELAGVLASVDVMVLPVLTDAPPVLEDAGLVASMRHTAPFNLAGLPAMAVPVPAGPADGTFPASLQLVGPARSEALLLATARAVESASAPG
jgi:Asp-tRNA(Asn)/Glu-tRNA(Gln) amidotransferase A subunit family amidase